MKSNSFKYILHIYLIANKSFYSSSIYHFIVKDQISPFYHKHLYILLSRIRVKQSTEAVGCKNASVGERSILEGSTYASRCG